MTDPRAALVHAARRLSEIGGLPASDGNLSARVGPRLFWISPSGIEKRGITPDVFLLIDDSGCVTEGEGRPSSEWPMHVALYGERREVNCILHAHPPNLTAFAAAHRVPETSILAEAEAMIGEICLVPYARPGSASLGKEIIACGASPSLYLLENHGAVAVGGEVEEALHRMERAEFLAQVSLLAEKLDGAIPLSETQLAELRRR